MVPSQPCAARDQSERQQSSDAKSQLVPKASLSPPRFISSYDTNGNLVISSHMSNAIVRQLTSSAFHSDSSNSLNNCEDLSDHADMKSSDSDHLTERSCSPDDTSKSSLCKTKYSTDHVNKRNKLQGVASSGSLDTDAYTMDQTGVAPAEPSQLTTFQHPTQSVPASQRSSTSSDSLRELQDLLCQLPSASIEALLESARAAPRSTSSQLIDSSSARISSPAKRDIPFPVPSDSSSAVAGVSSPKEDIIALRRSVFSRRANAQLKTTTAKIQMEDMAVRLRYTLSAGLADSVWDLLHDARDHHESTALEPFLGAQRAFSIEYEVPAVSRNRTSGRNHLCGYIAMAAIYACQGDPKLSIRQSLDLFDQTTTSGRVRLIQFLEQTPPHPQAIGKVQDVIRLLRTWLKDSPNPWLEHTLDYPLWYVAGDIPSPPGVGVSFVQPTTGLYLSGSSSLNGERENELECLEASCSSAFVVSHASAHFSLVSRPYSLPSDAITSILSKLAARFRKLCSKVDSLEFKSPRKVKSILAPLCSGEDLMTHLHYGSVSYASKLDPDFGADEIVAAAALIGLSVDKATAFTSLQSALEVDPNGFFCTLVVALARPVRRKELDGRLICDTFTEVQLSPRPIRPGEAFTRRIDPKRSFTPSFRIRVLTQAQAIVLSGGHLLGCMREAPAVFQAVADCCRKVEQYYADCGVLVTAVTGNITLLAEGPTPSKGERPRTKTVIVHTIFLYGDPLTRRSDHKSLSGGGNVTLCRLNPYFLEVFASPRAMVGVQLHRISGQAAPFIQTPAHQLVMHSVDKNACLSSLLMHLEKGLGLKAIGCYSVWHSPTSLTVDVITTWPRSLTNVPPWQPVYGDYVRQHYGKPFTILSRPDRERVNGISYGTRFLSAKINPETPAPAKAAKSVSARKRGPEKPLPNVKLPAKPITMPDSGRPSSPPRKWAAVVAPTLTPTTSTIAPAAASAKVRPQFPPTSLRPPARSNEIKPSSPALAAPAGQPAPILTVSPVPQADLVVLTSAYESLTKKVGKFEAIIVAMQDAVSAVRAHVDNRFTALADAFQEAQEKKEQETSAILSVLQRIEARLPTAGAPT